METYNYNEFKEAGLDMVFVQDNESKSKKGVLRGLHFQTRNSQGSLCGLLKAKFLTLQLTCREGKRNLRQMVRSCAEYRKQTAVLYSGRVCSRLLGAFG